jgi:hypothetical protein
MDNKTRFEEAAEKEADRLYHPTSTAKTHFLTGYLAGCEYAAPKWIDVKTALPEPGEDVLTDGGISYMNRDGTWYTVTGCEYPGLPIQWEVTHWMTLPKLPTPPTKD